MNRLKELRQKNCLTLEKLGQKVNIPKNTLSRYESGKRKPKIETWQRLADYFNVSTSYLMGLNSNNFGNRIKELRIKNGLSQAELAKKIGVKDNTICQYEKGKRHPNDKTWQKLADYFNVSIPSARGEIDTNKIQNILQTILFFNCSDDALDSMQTDEFSRCSREEKRFMATGYLMLLVFQELHMDPYDQFLLVVKKVANLLKLEGNDKNNFIKQSMSSANDSNEKHDIRATNDLLNFYDKL